MKSNTTNTANNIRIILQIYYTQKLATTKELPVLPEKDFRKPAVQHQKRFGSFLVSLRLSGLIHALQFPFRRRILKYSN